MKPAPTLIKPKRWIIARGGIELAFETWPGLLRAPRVLPLYPIWPGFAINTIFYAAILWLLFAAPFTLRRWRRIRRGLCVRCAYPVGTNAVCSECGASIPFPLRGRVREGVKRTVSKPETNDSERSTHPLAPSLKGGGNGRPLQPPL